MQALFERFLFVQLHHFFQNGRFKFPKQTLCPFGQSLLDHTSL